MNASKRQATFLLGIFVFFFIALVASLSLDLHAGGDEPQKIEGLLGSSLGFFFLINVNIIVVLVLAFLVVKNLVKLLLDRRRRILGSHLRSRLVVAFVALSLVPTVLLFFVSKGIVDSVLHGWFSPQISAVIDGSVEVAKLHYDTLEENLRQSTELVAGELQAAPDDLSVTHFAQALRQHGIDEGALLGRDRKVLLHIDAEGKPVERSIEELPPGTLDALREGAVVVRPVRAPGFELLQGYVWLRPQNRGDSLLLVTASRMPPRVSALLSSILDSYDDYRQLRSFRRPITSSYLLTLAIVTLMVVFAAIWVGFYLARTLTEPIRMLAGGTAEVARGNLAHRIPEAGDDEFGILVRSFNTMTGDLQQVTEEIVARRRLMETVLKSVNAGVLSVDTNQTVTTINPAAARMLGLGEAHEVVGKKVEAVLPEALREKFEQSRGELALHSESASVEAVSLYVQGQTRHLQVVATVLRDERGGNAGTVMLLDDLTELVSAQRMAAWREVAKRIAHEIKNPLTPIQLSAQRIQRRLLSEGGSEKSVLDRDFVIECTETIVQQVDALRSLVGEFSQFARLPNIHRTDGDVNRVIEEAVSIFRAAHPQVQFVVNSDPNVPIMSFDREQLNRVFVNLLDNGVSAVAEGSPPKPRIEIRSEFDAAASVARIAVSDNGVGIPDREKPKVLEPYYSTKKGGTGLGLAIVSSIIADHGGVVRVQDSPEGGARFVLELPVMRAEMKKRA